VFADLRLRTKLLGSFALVTAGLTCAALLVVRQAAKSHVQQEIEQEARDAISTFQVIQRQHQIALKHKADLLATLTQIRDGDASAIQDSSDDPWQSNDCNLFALADPNGKIIGLRTTTPGFTTGTAEAMLRRSWEEHSSTGWWYGGTHLYQVVTQPLHHLDAPGTGLLGTVVVGHRIDADEAHDLSSISSSQVVFRYGNDVVVSTLRPLQTQQFAQQIGDLSEQPQIEIDGEQFWASSVDLTPGAHPAVTLTVLKSYNGASAYLGQLNRLLLTLGALAVLGGGGLVFLMSNAFLHPLARLAGGVRALEQGDFSYALKAKGSDEVAEVTRAFARMREALQRNEANRQQLERQLRQAQRMEAMGRLAGGVAHDFNNLLTVIKGHSDLLLERLGASDTLSASTKQIAKAADRAASLTRQLLAFSRMQVLQPKVLELNALITDMEKMLTRLIHEDIAFSFQPGEPLGLVKADAGQVEQVILNLTVNACDAMPDGGRLSIETRNVTVDEQFAQSRPPMLAGDYVLLSVTDTGQGMDAETKARIFEPFFTTKELGKGTGLGLATVYGVIKQSGGCIWVESELGKGARFEVYFPRVSESAGISQPIAKTSALTGRDQVVLIAEDQDAVRELAAEFLNSAGYTVFSARDGVEALDLAKQQSGPIHLLLTDVVMPNMRGPELGKRLKDLRSDVNIIYMSGYLDYDKGEGEFPSGGLFLQKPFSRETLIEKVNKALSDVTGVDPSTQLIPQEIVPDQSST
jgi:signal transduction histidine kinase/ActR/RegA family two-component response regulator